LIQTANSKILLDCGINVANNEDPYPMLEVLGFPLNELNAIIISHAHTDHAGFLPYLYKSGYKGPVYCTSPTRDLMVVLQQDYLNVASKDGKDAAYSESDIREMLKHVITCEVGDVTDISSDIRLTLHNAAHILGSTSVHLHIGDGAHNIMYSADFKFGFTRLFDNMETNYPRLETLIIESTYGNNDDMFPQRMVSEDRLISVINETVEKGGNVLIPVFAVGRSQEVMLVLEDYYRRNKLKVNGVYIDGLIKDVCAIHTVYPEYLRANVQKRILQNNSPFSSPLFRTVDSKAEREEVINKKVM
jgi:predicted metal-dependent RNase